MDDNNTIVGPHELEWYNLMLLIAGLVEMMSTHDAQRPIEDGVLFSWVDRFIPTAVETPFIDALNKYAREPNWTRAGCFESRLFLIKLYEEGARLSGRVACKLIELYAEGLLAAYQARHDSDEAYSLVNEELWEDLRRAEMTELGASAAEKPQGVYTAGAFFRLDPTDRVTDEIDFIDLDHRLLATIRTDAKRAIVVTILPLGKELDVFISQRMVDVRNTSRLYFEAQSRVFLFAVTYEKTGDRDRVLVSRTRECGETSALFQRHTEKIKLRANTSGSVCDVAHLIDPRGFTILAIVRADGSFTLHQQDRPVRVVADLPREADHSGFLISRLSATSDYPFTVVMNPHQG